MKKSIDELLREYDAQCSDHSDRDEAKAYCCTGSDDSYECCQLCGALTCVSCCEAMCSG